MAKKKKSVNSQSKQLCKYNWVTPCITGFLPPFKLQSCSSHLT